MISRTLNRRLMESIANHPEVRPHIGGDPEAPLDLTAFFENDQNIALVGEHGGFLCGWSAPSVYEIHTMVLPEGRGQWAYDLAKAGRNWMEEFGALHLWTRVHPDAPHVRRFTLKAGFKPAGQNTIDLGDGPVTYDLFDWRAKCQQ
jgi:RimJ/RimL family protein N-acetyltransferase